MDNLDFLDGGEPPIAETQPQEAQAQEPVAAAEPSEAEQAAEPTETNEQRETRPRGPDGKFAKKDAEPVMVPLQALHETRDKVRDLEARLAAAIQPQEAQQPAPDVFDDGFADHLEGRFNQRLTNATLNMSEAAMRRAAGDELVAQAQEWGKQILPANPAFAQAFYGSPDPYGFLVDQFKQQTLMARVAADPAQIEAFLAWQQQGQAPQAQATQPQSSPPPPRSIAGATSAGGVSHAAFGPGVAFGETIK